MKKIGILTYFYSINEGAMLQAYALQEVCKKIFPDYLVEIINIESKKIKKRDWNSCFKIKKPIVVFNKLLRLRSLNKFKKSFFNLSKLKYVGDNYKESIALIDKNKYDIIIVGSDEIWKVGTEKDLERGFPNIYWLGKGINNCYKISYAASAHKTIYKDLSPIKQSFIKNALNKFDLIGVRDKHTYDLVKSVLEKQNLENKLWQVLDPTFLYDFSSHKINIKKILTNYKIKTDKPIALLICEDKKINKIFGEFFKKTGYQTIALGYFNEFAEINILNINPIEWTMIFKYANFCITDRFHGTIFCIKNKIPFLAIDHAELYKKIPSKIKQLLTEFGLENYLLDFTNMEYGQSEIFNKINFILKEKKLEKINNLLNNKKEISFNFIKKIKRP